MKKIAVFNLRQFDEAEWFERFSKELGLTISGCPDAPDMENIARVTGVNVRTSSPLRSPGS